MSAPGESARPPARSVSDADRSAADARLRRAVADGVLSLEDYTARIGLVYRTADAAELDSTVDDLATEPLVGTRGNPVEWSVGLFGDVTRAGAFRLGPRTTGVFVFGDVEYDLRQAYIAAPEVVIRTFSIFGDVEVIVPEGVEASIGGFAPFGDHRLALAAVPRQPGTPTVRVVTYSLFGDTTVRTGQPTKRLRDWLQRRLG